MSDKPQTTAATPYNRMAHWSIDDIRRALVLKMYRYRQAKQDMDEAARDIEDMACEMLRRSEK